MKVGIQGYRIRIRWKADTSSPHHRLTEEAAIIEGRSEGEARAEDSNSFA